MLSRLAKLDTFKALQIGLTYNHVEDREPLDNMLQIVRICAEPFQPQYVDK